MGFAAFSEGDGTRTRNLQLGTPATYSGEYGPTDGRARNPTSWPLRKPPPNCREQPTDRIRYQRALDPDKTGFVGRDTISE